MEVLNICNNPDLLPGFRFHPTDQELIVHYLRQKVTSSHSPVVSIIAEVDLYKFNPWELPGKAFFGEDEWFFFSPRDRKYPNGARPNRAAASGYWKATGTDKPILAAGGSMCLGVKKALVFYRGRPPKGSKTDWVMHEYRLLDNSSSPPKLGGSMRLDDWVLCRVRQKSSMPLQSGDQKYNESPEAPHSFDDQFLGKQFEIRTKNYSIEQNPESKQVFGQYSKICIEPRNVAPSFHVTSREAPSSSTISSLFAQESLGTGQFFSISPSIDNNNLQVIESPERIFFVGGELDDYMQLFPPPSKRLSTASNGVVNSRDEQSPPSNSMQHSCLSEFMV